LVKINNYEIPEKLHYSKDHMWVHIEKEKAKIGITDYAQKQLREIVYIELPNPGETLTKTQPFGTVESVKAVSDLIAPITGKIEQINEEVSDKPELLNEDPYNKAWLLIVSPTNLDAELNQLMDSSKAVEWHKQLLKEG